MIENQAYIIALMLLVASPLAIATDEGQAALERFSRTPDDLVYDATNDRTDMLDELDDSILNDVPTDKMNTQDVVEDCYTLEQWKERLGDRDWNKEDWNKDWEQESDEVREEDGARGNSDDKKEKEDRNKETDKVTDKDCFTEAEFEEFVGKMGNKDRADRDCVTVGQVREKWERIREGARDRDWDRDYDRDDDEDEDDRDDESDEGRDNDEDEGARSGDEEESDEADEERAELVTVIGELKEACEDGDEAACVELRELLEEYLRGDLEQDEKRDWIQEDRDDSRCVNKHMVNHMKEMADHMKEKFGRDRGHKDYDRDWERDDDDDNDDAEDDENDHDEDDEDDSEDEEDDSENDEPEEA